MRYVIHGAGAVGGVVGALLHVAGENVTLIARGDHLRAIRAEGLRLVTPGPAAPDASRAWTLRLPAVGGPAEIDWRGDEVVVVAVKSDATGDVARSLARHAPPSISVVSMQNGVANEPTLLRWFGAVYGICVMAPTTHLQPGVVEARSGPIAALLDVGRYPGGLDGTARAIAASISAAGMVSEPRADIMAWKYRKLVMNLSNAVDATCVPDDAARELTGRLREEADLVFDAAGITAVSEDEDRARRGDHLRLSPDGRAGAGSSSWQSLARATGTIEADYLNGAIVLLGRHHGVPAPLNEAVRRLANRMAAERAAPRSVDARMLLSVA